MAMSNHSIELVDAMPLDLKRHVLSFLMIPDLTIWDCPIILVKDDQALRIDWTPFDWPNGFLAVLVDMTEQEQLRYTVNRPHIPTVVQECVKTLRMAGWRVKPSIQKSNQTKYANFLIRQYWEVIANMAFVLFIGYNLKAYF